MAGAMFLFAAVDAQAKYLTELFHPFQITWSRQLGLLVGVLILLAIRGPVILRTRKPGLQILRGVLVASSATLFILAVQYVPLADAVAVTFVAPLIVTVLGAVILGEPVGIRRWTAAVIGLVGALVVIRPGLGALHPAGLLVLLAALFFAFRQILSRILAAQDPTVTTVAYTALAGSAILTLPLPFVWRWPETTLEIGLLLSIAVLAAFAEYLVIRALEVAQAVVVAPVHYSILVWSTIYGFLIFGQLPDLWTWFGAAIIVISGLYTFRRERQLETPIRSG